VARPNVAATTTTSSKPASHSVPSTDAQTIVAPATDLSAELPVPAAVSPTASHSTTSAASGVTENSSVASPAQQIAPTLLAIAPGQDGVQRLTVRLHPAELGMVQVQIERPAGGPANVAITVERAETLQMLMQDQPQLHRALDQAGVQAQGRSIAFHVASLTQPLPGASPSGNAPFTGGQGHASSSGGSAGGDGAGSYDARDQAGYGGSRKPNHFSPQSSQPEDTNLLNDPKWRRIGLDITA
jgi:Flagellar hook-length control protein FliK